MKTVLLCLFLCACSEEVSVKLTFGEDPSAATAAVGTPVAFRCRDVANKYLPARGVTGTGAGRSLKVAFVVDFIAMDGVPSCRPSDITRWCQDQNHDCHVISDDPNAARVCYDLSESLGLAGDAVHGMADLLAGLAGKVVSSDAPHDPVIVRVVATAESCADLTGGQSYATDQLVGCAFSCPVQLDAISGDILLDLPTLSDVCEASVDACAQGTFFTP